MSEPETPQQAPVQPEIVAPTPPVAHPAKKHDFDRRQIASIVATALIVLFAVLNTGKVKVDWIFGSTRSPLIIVIVVCAVLGALADRFLVHRAKRRQAKKD